MKRLILTIALAAAGCGSNGNDLSGSLSEVYSLDFDTVEIDQFQATLIVTYLKAPGSNVSKVAKLIVDTTNIDLSHGNTMIDLHESVNGAPRGTLQRVEAVTIGFPIDTGHMALDNVPMANATLTGSFSTTLADPKGRTLNGHFSAAVVPEQAPQ